MVRTEHAYLIDTISLSPRHSVVAATSKLRNIGTAGATDLLIVGRDVRPPDLQTDLKNVVAVDARIVV